MKKIYIKIISILFLSFFLFSNATFAKVFSIPDKDITSVAIKSSGSGDSLSRISTLWLNILHSVKIILGFVALIYLVYLGFEMMVAMGGEDKLTATKRQLYYTLIAFIFLNIPGQIYEMFSDKNKNVSETGNFTDVDVASKGNMLVNFDLWDQVVKGGILGFINVFMVALIIYNFTFAGISYMSSGAQEDKRKKARGKIIQGVFGLIFLGIIQVWVNVIYSGDIPKAQGVFAQIANIGIFFSGPVAIFFLILGGFYYITSAGDEAKAKKGIAIVKYTFIALIILLASYAFLKDLSCFTLDGSVPTSC
ncbi:MAG: hypothetical protein PHS92_05595 [Candidatus Gracilibacteria bacterium]|nr:hypothetical protein [Candidatus Gracilibacteria bacterium]